MYTTRPTNQTYTTDDYLFKISNYAEAKHVTKKGAYPTDVNHANEQTRNKNKKKETHSLPVYLHKFSTSKILFLFDARCPYIAGDIGCFPIFDAQTMNHAEKVKDIS